MRAGWPIKKIGDICNVMTGGTPSKSKPEYFGGGEINWLVSGDIHRRNITECEGRITKSGLKNSNAKFLPINSVMMALNGQGKTRGTVALLRIEATCNQSLVSVSPKDPEQLLPEYLYANLHGRYEEIRKITGDSGNDRRGLNMSLVKSIEIPIAPPEEQLRIVAILDEAFAGISQAVANAEKNLANARELFESYLINILTQKSEEWIDTTLGELCEKVEYGSSSKSKSEGSVPVLRMGNIQNGRINWDDLVYTDSTEEIRKYLLKNNDVLFNRTNSAALVGKTAIYKAEKPAIFAGYLIRIHRKENLIDAEFLNYYLNSALARKYGEVVMSRSINQANINGTKLKQYPISVPNLSDQKKFAEMLREMEMKTQHLETIYQQKLTALSELKQSILQKAFAGELTADVVQQQANG